MFPPLGYRLPMSRSLTELTDEALALPPESRAFLAEKLLETLDFEEDFSVGDAWREEIRKRCSDLDHGRVQTIRADAAISEVRKSLA
jgi:putative addiction module component (TIGR02574 family)